MAIIDGMDSQTRQHVYDPNASLESKKEFWKSVGLTKSGQKLFQEFEIDEDVTGALIIQIAKDLNPGVRFLTADMAAGATEVIVYRPLKYGLKRKPAVAPVAAVEPAQTDRNGKKLGASQLAWQEHAEWARTATSDQIRKRKAVDPSFRAFVVNSLRLEMSDEPVESAPSAAVQPEHPATGEDMRSELGAFATAYKRASASQLRPIGGFHKLSFPDAHGNVIEHSYSLTEWETIITAAAKVSLL